jgi:hypothetical protein
MIGPELMAAIRKRDWLVLAVVFILAAVVSLHAFDPDLGLSNHLLAAVLPCIGSLALLASDPGAWITGEEHPAFALDTLVPAVPPRAPPV